MTKDRSTTATAGVEDEPADETVGDGVTGRRKQRATLLDLLTEAGVASHEQLREALAEGLGSGERLGEVALRRGWIDEEALARVYASQWDQRFLAEESITLDPDAASLIPPDAARELGACVVGFQSDVPLVVLAEPTESRFAAVSELLGREGAFAVVTRAALGRLLDQAAALKPKDDHPVAKRTATATFEDDDDPGSLLAELDRATKSLVAFRGRAEPLVRRHQETADELAECRKQLAVLEDERASDLAERRRLEEELAEQHELVESVQAKLSDVRRALGSLE